MDKEGIEVKAVFSQEVAEGIITSLSDVKKEVRKYWVLLLFFLVLISSVAGGVGVWIFTQYKSPYVTFIKDLGEKTIIGVKNSGRINANTDDRTGEVTVEVYHAKR